MKKCNQCKKELGIENFCKDKKSKDGLSYYCKNCTAKWNAKPEYKKKRAEWNAKPENREKYFFKKLNWMFLKKYKISLDERKQMGEWQDCKCAICGVKENGRKLDVDHDHETGQIRMLLCSGCNRGVKITDNAKLLLAKSQYIETYQIPLTTES